MSEKWKSAVRVPVLISGYTFEIIYRPTIFCNLCIVQTGNSERSWCSHLRCRLILVTVLFIMCSYELTKQLNKTAGGGDTLDRSLSVPMVWENITSARNPGNPRATGLRRTRCLRLADSADVPAVNSTRL